MTREDVDTLSGPELSAAVAREIFGREMPLPPRSDDDFFIIPHACRNSAFGVLKRCNDIGIGVRTMSHLTSGWLAMPPEMRDWNLLTVDPSAVCRAALRAIREIG